MTYKKQKFLNGGEKTLNNTGYMTGSLDPYSLEFIEFAGSISGKSVDIGACFGIATLAALEAGADIIAIDNETKHLDILRQRAEEKNLNLDKLSCLVGALPDEISLEKNSIEAILCSRTLHLLRGEEIDLALKNIYDWLKPNGKIYLINDSVHIKINEKFNKQFSSLYKDNKQKRVRWPGHIPNVRDIGPKEFHDISPEYVTLMNIESITSACKEQGFEIIKAEYISRPDYPPTLQNDGRENVGIIATKTCYT